MKFIKGLTLLLLLVCGSQSLQAQTTSTRTGIKVTLSAEEYRLYQLIMEYRKSKNLPEIPLSKSLSYVARIHCRDLYNNKPDLAPGCNMHSWSDKDKWTACCYTPDHKNASCMWNKPSEITNYKGRGYEIACGGDDSLSRTARVGADEALDGWKSSAGHNSVIVNQGKFSDRKWKAIGIGMYKGFAMVWFGEEEDPDGKPDLPK